MQVYYFVKQPKHLSFTLSFDCTFKKSDIYFTGTNNINLLTIKNFCNVPTNTLKLEKVLVVSKLSIYEYERNKFKNLSDAEFEAKLRSRGSDFDKLSHFYDLHKTFETEVVKHFKAAGADVKVVNRYKNMYRTL